MRAMPQCYLAWGHELNRRPERIADGESEVSRLGAGDHRRIDRSAHRRRKRHVYLINLGERQFLP